MLRPGRAGGEGSGSNHSGDGDGKGRRDLLKGQRCRGVTRHNKVVSPLGMEKTGAFDRIAGYGLAGFRAVGKAGGIAKVKVAGRAEER